MGQKVLQSGILLVAGFIGLALIGFRVNFHFDMSLVLPFLFTCTLALLLNCLISINISLLAFWLSQTSGVFAMTSMIVSMASGGVLPLDVFGKKVMVILHVLPFQYTVYFPANVLNGRLVLNTIVSGVLMQLLWIVVLAVASMFVWKLGLKRYIAVGG
ncbi:MAG: ABC-2 family transporter protein [Alicyclobacillus sp.]|nr:ABC-2 family transporter protein [Alicyclobacillus sp.]